MSIIRLYGVTDKLANRITERWLLGIRQTNPAILDIFKDRNVKPYRDLLMWSGEFAGKYLTSAYYVYEITGNKELRCYVENFIDELVSLQAENGYLGCYSDACQITGAFSVSPEKSGDTWDSWGHYHIMIGLMLWYGVTGNAAYLNCVKKIADFYFAHFYNGNKKLSEIGWTEMNLAVFHGFAMFYNLTKEKRYLDFAKSIEEDMRSAGAEDYLSVGLSGAEFYTCKKPRWESLHVIMGFAEMYKATGDEKYKKGFLALADSILKTDIHNTGAFSTTEQAVGNPFSQGAIETCCVVAFDAMIRLAWEMTHETKYIEHLETAHYNAMLGAWSESGLWSTYDTPMNGAKRANFQDIAFQCRPGSPMLNCCSVNAPRGIAEIGKWIIAETPDEVFVNSFEDCRYESDSVKISVRGGFPYAGAINIVIDKTVKPIKIRVPLWSANSVVKLNGKKSKVTNGEYFTVSQSGVVELSLDFSPRFLDGELAFEGKKSVYAGCILFATDATANPDCEIGNLKIRRTDIENAKVELENGVWTMTAGGAKLVDFYHAGQSGCNYTTWLNIE